MQELHVGAGESIDSVVRRLAAQPPAFAVFNGVQLVSREGTSESYVWSQWKAEMDRREAALPRCPTCGKAL